MFPQCLSVWLSCFFNNKLKVSHSITITVSDQVTKISVADELHIHLQLHQFALRSKIVEVVRLNFNTREADKFTMTVTSNHILNMSTGCHDGTVEADKFTMTVTSNHIFKHVYRGPRWHCGNTLTSHL